MTIWEAMFATVPATAVGITVLVIVIKSVNKRIDDTNKRIDDTNKRIDDMSNRFDKRIDDLRELLTIIFGDEIRRLKFKKTGSDNK